VHYSAGDRIYEAGNRADGFFSVIEGAVEMTYTDPETGAPAQRIIGPGGHFGERLILGATRRQTTVRALEDSRLLVLDREQFLSLAEGFPAFREYFKPYMERHGVTWEPGIGPMAGQGPQVVGAGAGCATPEP